LFREEYYLTRTSFKTLTDEDRRVDRLAEVRNRLDLIVGKARNGPIGPVSVFFDASCNAARDLSEVYR
jgi:replicative DNA helicase